MFHAELRERLCLLISMGLSRRRACAYLGLDHTTLSQAEIVAMYARENGKTGRERT